MARREGIDAAPAADERYIDIGELRRLIPVSDMSLWRWQRDPAIAFPAPVKLGADGRNSWWLPAIRASLQGREERSVHRRGAAPSQRALRSRPGRSTAVAR